MNKISLKEARRTIAGGLLIASCAGELSRKSKELTYYPFKDKKERYVFSYLDESGKDDFEGGIASEHLVDALLVYNDYDVEG